MLLYISPTRILRSSWVRYTLVGGFSFVCELGLLYILSRVGLSSVMAVAISFWFGLLLSFLLQKLLAFQNYERSPQRLAYQAIVYGIFVLINYAFTLWLVTLLDNTLNVYTSRGIALAITTVWNYVVYSRIIFGDNNGTKE